MIEEIKKTFGSLTRALEILYVMDGIKKVTRMAFLDITVPVVEEFCRQNSLFLVKSDFKVDMDFLGQYSTKGRIQDVNSRGHYFVYISKLLNHAEDAKRFESVGNIREFGHILGYPQCCIDFFIKEKPSEEKKNNDYIQPALENSTGREFSYLNNIFGRYFDMPLLNHAPCSFNCEKSRGLAEKHLKIIQMHDDKLAIQLCDFLKSAIILRDSSIFLLPGVINKDDFVYKEVYSTNKDTYYEELKKNTRTKTYDIIFS